MAFLKTALISLISFSLAYIFTPITIPLCKKVGAIDTPDLERKINTVPMPRLGGIAFFFSTLIVLFPFSFTNSTIAALLSAGSLLVAGGFADDVFSLSAKSKFLIQSSAALVAITFIGLPEEFSFLGIIKFPLNGFLGFLFVLFRMVFTINAVNFSDGLDGLASGLSVVALVSLSIYGASNSNYAEAMCSIVLAAAVLGFLPYNKYHAKVFMGDSGSQFLGLAIALLSLGNAPQNNYTFETSLFLAVPSIDTFLSVVRRVAKKRSPFVADKGHLHHILLKLGVSHPTAVNLLIALSALIALCALLLVL